MSKPTFAGLFVTFELQKTKCNMSKVPRIMVKAFFVNGQSNTILSGETPKDAIEQYFFPDSMPVETLSIMVQMPDGKTLNLVINGNNTAYWSES